MDDRFNTIAGWILGAGIVALGGAIASDEYFKPHAPEKPGYEVADAEPAEGEGAAVVVVDIATLLPTADPAKGAEVFKKCTACHTANQGGANGIGPNLWGVMGKGHGGSAGFAYSDALKGVPGSWDFQGMDKWLTSPRKFAPGTKMTFAGLAKPEDRANLIVYLNNQGSNLPLPAAGAAPAAADAAAAAPAENAAAPAH